MNEVGSTRAGELALRLRESNEKLIELLNSLSAEQWRQSVPPDGRTVGVLTHHLSTSHPLVTDIARSVAAGGGIPLTWEAVDEWNAQHAKEHADCEPVDTINLLRESTAKAAALIEGFDDEQLERSAPHPLLDGQVTTVAELLERMTIGHTQWHLEDIRVATT
ncbi:MAG: DinB family protein [Candidatus Dormibacteraeota bacterium]|nr:DinB family protein [Candidatus Dormibacteraeota bacterium]